MIKILFFIRAYNDLDHFHPIVLEILKQNIKVIIISCTSSDLSNDYRVKNLNKHGAHFYSFRKVNLLFEKSETLLKIMRKTSQILSPSLGKLMKAMDVRLLCYEMSGPGGHGIGKLFFYPAKKAKISTIALPHGLNIYLNPDMTVDIRKTYRESGTLPDFSNRNKYDYYVLQTIHHKNISIKWKQEVSKILVMGSPRFSKTGVLQNLKLQKKELPLLETMEDKFFNVLFLLPHWNYNVFQDQVVEFLRNLTQLPNVKVIIKRHTRYTNNDLKYPENEIIKLPVEFSDLPTPILIEKVDAIINIGSSAGIDAIWLNKPLIYPKYLHSNETIFDLYNISYNVENWDQMKDLLLRLQSKEIGPKNDQSFVTDIIFGGDSKIDPTTHHVDFLMKLASR